MQGRRRGNTDVPPTALQAYALKIARNRFISFFDKVTP